MPTYNILVLLLHPNWTLKNLALFAGLKRLIIECRSLIYFYLVTSVSVRDPQSPAQNCDMRAKV